MNFSKKLNIVKTDVYVPTKRLTINKTRIVEKIPCYINIPKVITANSITNGRLLHQFNATLPSNFRIIEPIKYAYTNCVGILTVKFRVGSTVYRYAIWGNRQKTGAFINIYNDYDWLNVFDVYDIPQYSGELIGKNCCFEFWAIEEYTGPIQEVWGHPALKLSISLMQEPTVIDDKEVNINLDAPIDQVNLASTFPEGLPTDQTNIAWLDNTL